MSDDRLSSLFKRLRADEDPNPAFAESLFSQLQDEVAAPRRSSRTWVLLAAALLVATVAAGAAFGSGVIRIPWLIADADPTVEPTPSVEPPPSVSPTGEPTPVPTATAPLPMAQTYFARVRVAGVTLRTEPSVDAEAIDTFEGGEMGLVVQGPIVADGYNWYQISGLGLPPNTGCAGDPIEIGALGCPTWFGWVAGASLDGEEVWVAPTIVDCSLRSPTNMEELALAIGDMFRLGCYQDRSVTVRGWWPESPGEGLGGACASGPPAGWLYCTNINYDLVLMDDMEHAEGVGLKVYIDPESGVTMPERGQWIEIVGHFDDPAAQGCAENAALFGDLDDPDRIVLICRTHLVVDSVEPVSGPY